MHARIEHGQMRELIVRRPRGLFPPHPKKARLADVLLDDSPVKKP